MEIIKFDDFFKKCGLSTEIPYVELPIGDGENSFVIYVKRRLSFIERSKMVDEIADTVFVKDPDNDEQLYTPQLKRFAIEYCTIKYFTNIDMSQYSSIEEVWTTLDSTQLVGKIINVVGDEYVTGIVQDACEDIEYRKNTIINHNKYDEVVGKLIGLIDAVKTQSENFNLEDIMSKLEDYYPEWKDELMDIVKEHKSQSSSK